MDKTDYPLLAIVAAVALTALVAMISHSSSVPSASPLIALTDGFGETEAGLTGNVVAADRATRPIASPERARPELEYVAYDYTSDGQFTSDDTAVLAAVVLRQRFCPAEKICDVNGDAIIDDADRRAYDATVLRMDAERQEAYETLVGRPALAPNAEDEFWIAVTGAPLS